MFEMMKTSTSRVTGESDRDGDRNIIHLSNFK